MGAYIRYNRENFKARTLVNGEECWVWQGNHSPDGYGRVTEGYTAYLAHHLAYKLFVGPLEGFEVLHHTCENRACCNPQHLVPLTRAEHMQEHASTTTFPCGHPRTTMNTRPDRSNRRGQACRECHRQYMREYHAKRKHR